LFTGGRGVLERLAAFLVARAHTSDRGAAEVEAEQVLEHIQPL
jgi:hypothetical protein